MKELRKKIAVTNLQTKNHYFTRYQGKWSGLITFTKKDMATVIKIRPDVEVMPKEDYESPELKAVIVKEDHSKFCPHEHIRIFEHHRLVQCSDCGASLDPFDYILSVGRQEGNKLSEMTWLKYQIKNLTEERDVIKKEISKLRSQAKKLA
jgi:hypothetical protein